MSTESAPEVRPHQNDAAVFDEKVIWGISESEGSDSWDGPYETREEAEAAVRSEYADGGYIAPAGWPSAAKCAASTLDLDQLLERMEEAGDFCADEQLFEPKGKSHEAEAALRAALEAWAEQHVSVTRWMITGEAIRVEAEPESR